MKYLIATAAAASASPVLAHTGTQIHGHGAWGGVVVAGLVIFAALAVTWAQNR